MFLYYKKQLQLLPFSGYFIFQRLCALKFLGFVPATQTRFQDARCWNDNSYTKWLINASIHRRAPWEILWHLPDKCFMLRPRDGVAATWAPAAATVDCTYQIALHFITCPLTSLPSSFENNSRNGKPEWERRKDSLNYRPKENQTFSDRTQPFKIQISLNVPHVSKLIHSVVCLKTGPQPRLHYYYKFQEYVPS